MQPLPQAVCMTPQLLVRLEIGWLVRASCVKQASDIWNDRKNCLAAEATLVSLIHARSWDYLRLAPLVHASNEIRMQTCPI